MGKSAGTGRGVNITPGLTPGSLPVLLPILDLAQSHSITLEWPDSLGLARDSSHSITLHHTQSNFPRSPFEGEAEVGSKGNCIGALSDGRHGPSTQGLARVG